MGGLLRRRVGAKIVGALLDAGFTEEQIEAAFTTGGFNLEHLDRYDFGETRERSATTFEEVAARLGPTAPTPLPRAGQMFGLPRPSPSAHLPREEESLLEAFFDVWRTGDDETLLRAARLAGERKRLAALAWPELFSEKVAAPVRDKFLRQEVDRYPREVIDAGVSLARLLPRLLPRLVLWLIDRFCEQLVTSGIVANFEEVLA